MVGQPIPAMVAATTAGAFRRQQQCVPDADAGPELAAAVANAGGLGFLWAARLSPAKLTADYSTAVSLLEPGQRLWADHRQPSVATPLACVCLTPCHEHAGVPASSIGLGFNSWQLTDEALAAAVSCRPAVVWLAFPDAGRDFAALLPRFSEAGCKVLCMVQTLDQAEEVVRTQVTALCNVCEVARLPLYSSACCF